MFEKLTKKEFSEMVLNSQDVTIVSFSYEWSGSAYINESRIKRVLIANNFNIHVYNINIDQEYELATEFDALLVNSIIIFNGGKPVARFTGLISENELKNTLQNL